MITTGIFTGYFPYGLEETAQKIKEHGFNTVQLDLEFKRNQNPRQNIITNKRRTLYNSPHFTLKI